MYLKELRLTGFKSFADPTKLTFEPGVTAIVGPNGCGKSNVADGIRWVLGEQSAKSLRGGSMQDVIFQGTDKRKPLGLCEVFLTFADCEAQLGTAFSEVEIGRRVVRDGGSDYFINGKSCRLKDIQRLFLDTGIGQVSYSFLVQGQIDRILSTNPAERRSIFEEAAGISKYKAQRKEALNKLALVEQNLARAQDVIDEVGRQLNSTKRQATKAVRYQRVRTRLTHLDLALHAHQAADLKKERDTLLRERETLATELDGAEEELASREQARQEQESAREGHFQRLQDLQSRVYDFREKREETENRILLATQRIEDAEKAIGHLDEEEQQLRQRLGELAEEVEGSQSTRQEESGRLGEADASLRDRENRAREAKTAWLEAAEAVRLARGKLAALENERRVRESEQARLEERHDALLRRKETVLNERRELESQDAARQQQRDDLELRTTALTKQQADVEARLQSARQAIESSRAQFRDAQGVLQEVERTLAQTQARQQILEDLRKQHEGVSAGTKAVLDGKIEVASLTVKALAEALTVEPDWVQAVSSLLGTGAEAAHVRGDNAADEVLGALRERKLGRATLHVPVPQAEPPETLPEGWRPASAVVTLQDEETSGSLAGCYVCADLGQLLSAWPGGLPAGFVAVATRAGVSLDRRGFLVSGPPEKSRGIFERAAEASKLAAETVRLEKEQQTAQAGAEAAQKALDTAENTLESIRQEASAAEREQASLVAEQRSLEQEEAQTDGRRQSLKAEEESLQSEVSNLHEKQAALAQEGTAAEENEASLRREVETAEARVATLQQELETAQEALGETRLAVAEFRQKVALLEQSVSELSRRRTEADTRLEGIERERQNHRDRIEDLNREVTRNREEAARFAEEIEAARRDLEETRTHLSEVESSLSEVRQRAEEIREQVEEQRRRTGELDVELARRESRLEGFSEQLETNYGRKLGQIEGPTELWRAAQVPSSRIQVDALAEADDSEALAANVDVAALEPTAEEVANQPAPDWEEIASEVRELRSRLETLGPVNIDAIEQYRDLKERHGFLQGQVDDLTESRDQLLAGIDEINTTSQALFAETFEKIRLNFADTFERLFGGGEADLRLEDDEDPLESGVEITARPPGTRLRSLALLSGGQKTMTAVALLFAIYMVKPSPFCLLDELDAPLDDANIGRFVDMLRQNTAYSQFAIITHNKRTIAAADAIYGVTMPERGVSKVFAMRYEQAREVAEEAAFAAGSRTANG